MENQIASSIDQQKPDLKQFVAQLEVFDFQKSYTRFDYIFKFGHSMNLPLMPPVIAFDFHRFLNIPFEKA